MNQPFIIDAHFHTGAPNVFFAPSVEAEQLLPIMDRLGIRCAVCMDHVSIHYGAKAGLPRLRRLYDGTAGRLHYLGVYVPQRAEECIQALTQAAAWPGFAGLKIHPSFHRTAPEDPLYEPAWRFAAEHDLPILTHSWSVSTYNPSQQYSTPERFERYVRQFPNARLVLGHAGGRGAGRREAVRMANEYPNVYIDFSGDIFCYRLIEDLAASVPPEKILFGSDAPWLDFRAHLSRVLLADVDDRTKRMILRDNAARVYKIGSE